MDTTQYVIVCLMAVFTIYMFLTVLSSQDYPTATITQNMTAGTNYSFSPVGAGMTSVQRLYNASLTCASGNYSTSSTVITLLAAKSCVQYLVYSVDYTYNQSKTVMGMNLSFIVALLVLIFIGLVAMNLMAKNKK